MNNSERPMGDQICVGEAQSRSKTNAMCSAAQGQMTRVYALVEVYA